MQRSASRVNSRVMRVAIASAIFGVVVAGAALPVRGTTFPLAVSANGRYLVDQNNAPFRIHGDSPWDLLVTITSSEVDTYLDNRATKGFNTLLMELIEHKSYAAGSPAPANRNGDRPF